MTSLSRSADPGLTARAENAPMHQSILLPVVVLSLALP